MINTKTKHCICDKLIWQLSSFCRSCAHKEVNHRGHKNPGFKDGRTLLKYFCSCGKKLSSYQSKQCRSCATKKQRLEGKCYFAKRPNKPENKLIEILNYLFPKEYMYVGNGQLILGGLNPDFVNVNGQKKIIELYGDYWHNLPKNKKVDEQRLCVYECYGYKTLIIWEHELKDLNKLENKIKEFHSAY